MPRRKPDYTKYSKEELIAKIAELEKRKKYGLVWDEEREPEKVVLQCKKHLPVLKEIKSKAIQNDRNKPTHILIEGDNYHALSVLNYTHHNAIDVIYIDPPYNTGAKDFKYNDTFVEKDDAYRHSKWLSFMEKRLKLAKYLLKNDGVLFISINEQEFCQLKLLCDEIFHDYNYLTSFTIKLRHEDRILKGDKDFHEVVEYLLLYRKSRNHKTIKRIRDNTSVSDYVYEIEELTETPNRIEMGSKIVDEFSPKQFRVHKKEASKDRLKKINIRGSIKEGNSSGRFYIAHLEKLNPEKNGYLYKVPNMGSDGLGFRYFLTPSSDKKLNGDYFQGVPENTTDIKEIPYPNYFDFESDFNNVGYEGGIDFRSGKKPVTFILKIFEIGGLKNKTNGKVLDFFAGSGSTGHAVLEFNKIDNGTRTFIMCTNNEGNICREITLPRIKNAICGFVDNRRNNISGLGGNIKYFKTTFVPAEATDRNKEKLTKQSVEMLCLKENTFEPVSETSIIKIFKNNDRYTGILFDELKIPEFKKKIRKFKKPVSVYIFSLGDDDFAEEFEDMKDKVKVCSIPAAILRVYKRIFR